jgi:hypothetical protein
MSAEALSERVDTRALLVSLRSVVCPACGGPKKTMQTLCRRDFYSLPTQARRDLWRQLGHGYREAVLVAMEILGKAEFILPPEK